VTIHLTAEASYRMEERLGMILEGRKCPPALWDEVAMAALRWQRKHDPRSPTTPHNRPESPVLDAE
jgi:hypothetical protein